MAFPPAESGTILVTGSTGFIGGRLLAALSSLGYRIRCFVRRGEVFRPRISLEREPEVVEGDLLDASSLGPALEGVTAAYYLVHSMGGRSIRETRAFADRDRACAENFTAAADRSGLGRIIYLGGLGETGRSLSKHLSSRQEVAQILRSGGAKATVLRAAVIIGAGGASFEIVKSLVEKLPVMVCPRWIDTRCQPIAVGDVIAYLTGCLASRETEDLTLDIGGPEIITYRSMMTIYARARGLRRLIVSVPLLTPRLSAYWVNLLTPVPAGIVFPLIEGLKNEVVCRDTRITELVPHQLQSMEEAFCTAISEASAGAPSVQSCLLGYRER
jgi:uncharacterized protein YbjT (DUF2867 family)